MKTIRYQLFCLIPALSLLMPTLVMAAGFCPEGSTVEGAQVGAPQQEGPSQPPFGWRVINGAWDPTSRFATVFWLGHFNPPRINCGYYSGLSLQREAATSQSPVGTGQWRCVSDSYCMCSGSVNDCPLP